MMKHLQHSTKRLAGLVMLGSVFVLMACQPQEQQQDHSAKQDPNEPKDPNEAQQEQPQQDKEQQQQAAPDATAQGIVDRERRRRENTQKAQRARWQKVEKDW